MNTANQLKIIKGGHRKAGEECPCCFEEVIDGDKKGDPFCAWCGPTIVALERDGTDAAAVPTVRNISLTWNGKLGLFRVWRARELLATFKITAVGEHTNTIRPGWCKVRHYHRWCLEQLALWLADHSKTSPQWRRGGRLSKIDARVRRELRSDGIACL